MQALGRYSWPGNVRELENLVERSIVLCRSDWIGADALPGFKAEAAANMATFNRDARRLYDNFMAAALNSYARV